MPEPALDELRLRRLIDAGRGLIATLDVDAVLQRLLDLARELTGARWKPRSACSIPDRQELKRFLTAGVEPEVHDAIGDLPRGRGILGLLIEDPHPIPRSGTSGSTRGPTGFPAATRGWRRSSACRS